MSHSSRRLLPMPLLGAHTTAAGGVEHAPYLARHLGYNTIQIFVRNRAAWHTKPFAPGQAERFRDSARACGIAATLAHTSYLINLCSSRDEVRAKSMIALRDELARCEALGIPGLVMHPGAPGDRALDWGIEAIAAALDELFDESGTRDGGGVPPVIDPTTSRELQAGRLSHIPTRLLLETTAGQGASVGCRFEHLAAIMRRVRRPERLGVCLDTCHVFAAGYDLRSRGAYEQTIAELDRVIGLARLGAIHLNDSLRPLGSRVDRHAHIGKGWLGVAAFGYLLNDPRLARIPMVIETPKSERDFHEDIENLALLRQTIDWPARLGW